MKKITNSSEETIEFAKQIAKKLRGGDVLAYKGSLGVGKTTFTRGLAIGLGLGDMVSSPTFSIVNEYRGEKLSLYHFDMYRILNSMELESTGFYDYMGDDSILAIEWSENILDALPKNTTYVELIRIDEDKREIIITGDERFA